MPDFVADRTGDSNFASVVHAHGLVLRIVEAPDVRVSAAATVGKRVVGNDGEGRMSTAFHFKSVQRGAGFCAVFHSAGAA